MLRPPFFKRDPVKVAREVLGGTLVHVTEGGRFWADA